MIDTGLSGKVALITGANHGIGAATAKAFAAQGAAIAITYLSRPIYGENKAVQQGGHTDSPGMALYHARQAQSADKAVDAIREQGGRAEARETDLADSAVIPALYDWAETSFGPVEVLVNNAAYCVPDTFLPQSRPGQDSIDSGSRIRQTVGAQEHDRHFAVNSRATALMMAEFARRHIERGAAWGRIINVSTDGASAFSGEISYGASKHALESYSRAGAAELGPYGITVNIVSPGPVQTGYIDAALEQAVLPDIPLRRIGQPEDIADVIVFLASEQARWVTGQLLYVGGGHVMPL